MLPISLQPQLAGTAQPALYLTAALLRPCALQAEHGLHETEGREKWAGRKHVWVLLPELIPPSATTSPFGDVWGCVGMDAGQGELVSSCSCLQSLGSCPAALNSPTLGRTYCSGLSDTSCHPWALCPLCI